MSGVPGVSTPTPTISDASGTDVGSTDQMSPTDNPSPTEGPPITPIPKAGGGMSARVVVFSVIGVLLVASVIGLILVNKSGKKPPNNIPPPVVPPSVFNQPNGIDPPFS
jgi:hypothetical protein